MPFFLYDLFHRRFGSRDWHMPLTLLVFGLSVGWAGTWLFEPASSDAIWSLRNFWWFAEVSGTTIGYGDYYPHTTGGRLATSVMQWCVIIAFLKAFAMVQDRADDRRFKRLKGLIPLHMHSHVVVAGNHPTLLPLLRQLIGRGVTNLMVAATGNIDDPTKGHDSVIEAAFRGVRNYNTIEFVDEADLRRAACLVVNLGDDTEALFAVLAVRRFCPELPIVVALASMASRPNFDNVPGDNIAYVDAGAPEAVAAEVVMPGANFWIFDLLSVGDDDLQMMVVPGNAGQLDAFEIQQALVNAGGGWYQGYTDLDGVNHTAPHFHLPVTPGCKIWYSCNRSIELDEVPQLWRSRSRR